MDESNLQRQVLHSTAALGEPKVESAERRVRELNPDVEVVAYRERLSADNVDRILDEGWEVIVDGADNFPTRYLLNDASVWHGIPVVHGSIFRFEGQATVFALGSGPCYRCLFPQPPPPELAPSCAEGGVLGVLPGVIGSIQGAETLKLVLGIGEPLVGRLLLYDALAGSFDEVSVRRDPDCPGLRRLAHDHRVRRLRRVLCWYPAEVRRELERHALEEAPNEACGLVVLRDGRAVGYERGRNADASPYRFRLEVEPEVWFLGGRGLRARRLPLASELAAEAVARRPRAGRPLGGAALADPAHRHP